LVVILAFPIDIFYAQGPCESYIRLTVESDSDCQNTNSATARSNTLTHIKYFIHQTAKILISVI